MNELSGVLLLTPFAVLAGAVFLAIWTNVLEGTRWQKKSGVWAFLVLWEALIAFGPLLRYAICATMLHVFLLFRVSIWLLQSYKVWDPSTRR